MINDRKTTITDDDDAAAAVDKPANRYISIISYDLYGNCQL